MHEAPVRYWLSPSRGTTTVNVDYQLRAVGKRVDADNIEQSRDPNVTWVLVVADNEAAEVTGDESESDNDGSKKTEEEEERKSQEKKEKRKEKRKAKEEREREGNPGNGNGNGKKEEKVEVRLQSGAKGEHFTADELDYMRAWLSAAMKGGGVVVGTAEVMLTQRREDGIAKAREMLKTVGSLCFVILFDLKEGRGWEVPTVSAEQEDIRHLLRNWANANTPGKFEIEDPLTHKHPMYSGGQHTWWGAFNLWFNYKLLHIINLL